MIFRCFSEIENDVRTATANDTTWIAPAVLLAKISNATHDAFVMMMMLMKVMMMTTDELMLKNNADYDPDDNAATHVCRRIS